MKRKEGIGEGRVRRRVKGRYCAVQKKSLRIYHAGKSNILPMRPDPVTQYKLNDDAGSMVT